MSSTSPPQTDLYIRSPIAPPSLRPVTSSPPTAHLPFLTSTPGYRPPRYQFESLPIHLYTYLRPITNPYASLYPSSLSPPAPRPHRPPSPHLLRPRIHPLVLPRSRQEPHLATSSGRVWLRGDLRWWWRRLRRRRRRTGPHVGRRGDGAAARTLPAPRRRLRCRRRRRPPAPRPLADALLPRPVRDVAQVRSPF